MASVVTYQLWLRGNPRPKGSWTPVKLKSGGFGLRHASKHVAAWCKSIQRQLAEGLYDGPIHEGPVALSITFHLKRGKTVKRKYPIVRGTGDLDKLERAILDALTGVAYVDDVQVVHISSWKHYTDGEPGAGVTITTDGI